MNKKEIQSILYAAVEGGARGFWILGWGAALLWVIKMIFSAIVP